MTPEIKQILDRLNNIQVQLETLSMLVRMLVRETRTMENDEMATQETLDRLAADVTANTNATNAAAAALTGFVQTVADLTQQLQDAIAANDEAAISAAADALEANNLALNAAIPTMSIAVTKNTTS